jgi:hypothetical protein|tara:strand:- start:6303 stop:6602 length:300 start_codon:yes stop_codon:yes gene_type:complete
MAKLREEAQGYEPKRTLNIAELTAVPLDDLEVLDGSGENKDGKVFHYKYTLIDGKEYRIPSTVLEEIQKILKIKPEAKIVKVNKSGVDLNTKYTVDLIE